jgi:predicted O-methyltransferase YrrM
MFREKLGFVTRYIRFLVTSNNEHGVHSPFVFNLLTKGIYNRSNDLDFANIETIRSNCAVDKRIIQVTDLGAGSHLDGKNSRRSISYICRTFAKSPKMCKVLYRTLQHLKPYTIIELGTSLGLSAMYLASANENSRVISLEGCPNTADIARENISKSGLKNISVITGAFDELLPDLLEANERVDAIYIDGNHTHEATTRYFNMMLSRMHNNSFIIFDDINWSKGMVQAWNEITSHDKVTMSVDFFHFGMVFFNPGFSKEHFRIRI